MKIYGQRWLYRIGNTEVAVDNAFSLWGWAQERWLINGEVIRETGGWFALKRSFAEPWLTTLGEGTLAAELRSRLTGVDCSVTLDGEAIPHDTLFEAEWTGRKSWPAAGDWKEVAAFSAFNLAGMS